MRAAAAIGALLLAGCNNPCQDICTRMADYAVECGFQVPDAEVDACIDAQADGLEPADKEACRDYGTPDSIRNEWSCEDLAQYWGEGGSEDAR